MSSSAYIDNTEKDILVLAKAPTQGLGHTLTPQKMYSIYCKKKKNLFELPFQWSKELFLCEW